MRKIVTLVAFVFTLIASQLLLTSQTLAQSSYDPSDPAPGFLMGFVIIYYVYACIAFLASFLHLVLGSIAIIDIAKRPNEAISKDTWILLILVPGTTPILGQLGGVFISVAAELYYLFYKRNQIQ